MPPLSPDLTDHVERDPQRPRADLALPPETRQLPQEPNGRLLDRVAGEVRVAEEAEAEAVPRVLKRSEQGRSGGAVAESGCVNRRRVQGRWSLLMSEERRRRIEDQR